MSEMFVKALWMYGVAIVVSLLIAGIIKAIVALLGRIERRPVPPVAQPLQQAAQPADAAPVPLEHVAAIAAAVQAMIGGHRILRIEEGRRGAGWVGEGRLAHHTSHAVRSGRPRR